MIIELAGASGSGKTFLTKVLGKKLKGQGYRAIQLRKLAWRDLIPEERTEFLFDCAYPGAAEATQNLPKERTPEARHAAMARQLWMSSLPLMERGLACLHDEGFFHRTAHLAAAGASFDEFMATLDLQPRVHAIAYVSVPIEVAEARVVERMEEHRREARLKRFRAMAKINETAAAYMERALPLLEDRGVLVAHFDGAASFRHPASEFAEAFAKRYPAPPA